MDWQGIRFARQLAVVLGAAGFLAASSAASAITWQNDGSLNSAFSNAYSQRADEEADEGAHRVVGGVQVRVPASGENPFGQARGSGTLIGRRWMLTAAHVVDDARRVHVNINGVQRNAQRWFVPQTWNRDFTEGNDLALLKLKTPAWGAGRPADLYRGSNEFGKEVWAVGHGLTGDGFSGGFNPTHDFNTPGKAAHNELDVRDSENHRQLAFDFDLRPSHPQFPFWMSLNDRDRQSANGNIDYEGDMYPISLEGATAPGDSGGGWFIDDQLAGITSWGAGFLGNPGTGVVRLGHYGSLSYGTRVSRWIDWIRANIWRANRGYRPKDAKDGSRNNPIFDIAPIDHFSTEFVKQAKRRNGVVDVSLDDLRAILIPEPTSLTLVGLGALVLLRRRRPGACG